MVYMSNDDCYYFDDFRLDRQTRILYRGAEHVSMEPRVADMLAYLVEHRDRVVTKDELLTAIWGKIIVEEGVLRRNIGLMRNALDPDNRDRYIQTHRGLGYRFMATVTTEQRLPVGTAIGDIANDSLPSPSLKTAPSTNRLYQRLTALAAAVVVIGLAFIIFRSNYGNKIEYDATRITFVARPSQVIAAAISPDGKLIAYANSDALYVSDADAIQPSAQPLMKGLVPIYMSWYPDSIHMMVSYISFETGEQTVWKHSSLGGAPELIIQDARMAAVSPDGLRMLFVRGDNQIWLADSQGTHPFPLFTMPTEQMLEVSPHFTPDSKFVVVCGVRNNDLGRVFHAVNIQSRSDVIFYETNHYVAGFLPLNSHQLLISQESEIASTSFEVISIEFNLQTRTHSAPAVINQPIGEIIQEMTLTQDSQTVLFISSRAFEGIHIGDLSDEGRRLTNIRSLQRDEVIRYPGGWMSDGKSVIQVSLIDGNFNLFSQSIDEDNPRTLVIDQHDKFWPAVSADGRWLLYFVDSDDKKATTLMRHSMSNGVNEIIDTKPDTRRTVRCARQVNRCAIMEHTESEEILYEFSPDSGTGKELARMKWRPMITFDQWDLSPDGQHVAYVDTTAEDLNDIGLLDISANPARRTQLHIKARAPLRTLKWDAAGTGFYACSANLWNGLLWMMHVDRDGTTQLLHWQLNNSDCKSFPSPDGKHLAFHQVLLKSNLWRLDRK